MSTGLVVQKATYGSTSGTPVDVTSAVASKVKDGVLSFTVSPSSFGIEDPAPGQLKEAYVAYTINGGRKNEITKKDNDLVKIDAPPVREASGLQITKAEYGYSGNWTDVTNAVQDLMKSDGSINITVGFKALGLPDPNPNKQKELRVDYSINGATSSQSLKDGETFTLSAPAAEDTSGPSVNDQANSLFGLLLSGLGLFITALFCFTSAFASVRFATEAIGDNSAIWWIFFSLGLFPLFGFIGLPFFVFIARLFVSSDFVTAYTFVSKTT
jgi:hypothetical protein